MIVEEQVNLAPNSAFHQHAQALSERPEVLDKALRMTRRGCGAIGPPNCAVSGRRHPGTSEHRRADDQRRHQDYQDLLRLHDLLPRSVLGFVPSITDERKGNGSANYVAN